MQIEKEFLLRQNFAMTVPLSIAFFLEGREGWYLY